MDISYDPVKCASNIVTRDLSFELVTEFDFSTALYAIDDRHDYGEVRLRALGTINARVYAVVFVETVSGIRVISFRKANKREVRRYEKKSRS